MTREDAKDYINEQEPSFLTKTRKGYICSACRQGATQGNGLTRATGRRNLWHCINEHTERSVLGLFAIHSGIPDDQQHFPEIIEKAAEYYGIIIDDARNQKQYKTERNTQQHIHNTAYTTKAEPEQEPDYTDFFLQANKHITETDYHRGITLETLNRFKIGFVKSWRHPKAPNAPASPRLIIPTSQNSYLARDTRANLTEQQNNYAKSKVGKVRIFNIKALAKALKPVFVVEGELDALSIEDVGGTAIALGSTSNTTLLLKRLETQKPAKPLIVALDNDKAGAKASQELIEGLKGLEIPFFEIDIVKPFKDANEALNANRDAFRAAVEQAIEQVEGNVEEALEAEREQMKKEAVAYSLQDFISEIEKSKTAACYSTGWGSLDNLLDGGLYSGLYIFGAISSLGKTTFCLQLCDNIAVSGQDVLIFSLEMARTELIAKSVSRLTLIKDLEDNGTTSHAKTTRGILTGSRYKYYNQTEKTLIQAAVAAYGQYGKNIYITEGVGNVGIKEIRAKIEKHIAITGKKPVVLIDYLQIIAPADVRATDKQNTDKAVLELKRISRDYSIPIIGISSFNRNSYTDPVNMAAFKESGAIEYSSDTLIGLQLEGMDYQEGEADGARQKRIRKLVKEAESRAKNGKSQSIQVKVLKNRNGSKGDTLLDFYPAFNYFTEKPKGAENNEYEDEDGDGYRRAESSGKW